MMHPDRKVMPRVNPVRIGKMIQPEVLHLGNGVPVYLLNEGEEEIVRIDFLFNAGQAYEKMPLVSSTTNMMLSEGTENFTAEKLNIALDYYGAVFNLFAEKDSAGLSVAFLTKYTLDILELCNEILFKPLFPADELETLIKKRIQWFEVSRERIQNLATEKFYESVFGATHPYGRQVTLDDFTAINREMLKDFHLMFYTVSNLKIIVAGRIPLTMLPIIERIFGGIQANMHAPSDILHIADSSRPEKIFLEKKGAIQSAIRIGSKTIGKKHPDYHGLKILDTVLGGYFGSRLMKNIREEKGYTYGISSSVVSFSLGACKVISSEVGSDYSGHTIAEIFNEIKRLQEEHIPHSELEVVRNYMLGEMARMFDGPFSTADTFRAVLESGLDYNYYSAFEEKIKSIEPDEIIRLAITYYKTDDLSQIVVGPV